VINLCFVVFLKNQNIVQENNSRSSNPPTVETTIMPPTTVPFVKIDEEMAMSAGDMSAADPNGTIAAIKDIAYYRNEIKKEKAGKRKLFHALHKLAGELKKVKSKVKEDAYRNTAWYEGGLWRAPQVLPEAQRTTSTQDRARPRDAISLSDMFFNLVVVVGFTRVGLAITRTSAVKIEDLLYFATFWTIWGKEASYSSRFDTTDLSAKVETLLACFAVLFASLSVSLPMDSEGGARIMYMAGFCSFLHFGLSARVLWWYRDASTYSVDQHVKNYATFNTLMNLIETSTWICGVFFVPTNYRWIVFLVAVAMALRVPRAFLANDFHGACVSDVLYCWGRNGSELTEEWTSTRVFVSQNLIQLCFVFFTAANSQRGVLFILLLGFMLQSVVVVATDFFEWDTPNWEQYSFIGACCLLMFCIKLLYVDDANTLAADHALLVNRTAAWFFNIGQFALLFSTTIMGSGLNLLTHSYLAATAALPGPAKNLVCGGFAAVLLSTTFIKSMHIKRVPVDGGQRALFVGAYVVQALATLAVAGICIAMCFGEAGYLQILMENDVELM
jgi:Bacterial low temperature requirement A protein (LtrA)